MPAPIWWLLAQPFVAGACLPLQAGINGQLAKQVSSVLSAALLSFAVGTLALLLVVLAHRQLPDLGALKGLSWWQWSGGKLAGLLLIVAGTNDAWARLKSAQQVLQGSASEVQLAIRAGEVEPTLHAYQAEHGIDLLAMGAYGHSRIRQFLVGSTTSHLLRRISSSELLILR